MNFLKKFSIIIAIGSFFYYLKNLFNHFIWYINIKDSEIPGLLGELKKEARSRYSLDLNIKILEMVFREKYFRVPNFNSCNFKWRVYRMDK